MMRWLLSSILYCFLAVYAKEYSMHQAKKAAREEADMQMNVLKKQLLGKQELAFTDDDLLPEKDKGKKFEINIAEQNVLSLEEDILKMTKKRDNLDGDEDFFSTSREIIQNPLIAGDIASLNTTTIPEEEKIRVCHERGTYQVFLTQTLVVNITPEIKKTLKQCKGHEYSKDFFWKSDADDWRKKREASLSHHSSIASYSIKRLDGGLKYTVLERYVHKDDTPSCSKYITKETISESRNETETWETDFPERLAEVEQKPHCKLLYEKPLQGQETRIINGLPVFRNVWERQLIFSCEPGSESPCAQLRERGGVLKSKKCLETNSFGECDLWEKSYDLGKKGAFTQTTASFKEEPIWGLENEFEQSYEKNEDFGQILSTLSVFADLENNLEEQHTDILDHVKIFKGEAHKCEKSFLQGNVFDCCKEMDGLAVVVKLARCTSEEQALAENRYRGKCRFIGTRKAKLGTVNEHVYCCFPTKLARVLHEQGRKQLNLHWGDADKPKCRGFTLQELQKIDFSKIDFTEVIDEIKVDRKAYEQKLHESLNSLKAKVQQDVNKRLSESKHEDL